MSRLPSSTTEVRVCFFDLDGTLVDSHRPILVSLNRALSSHGLESISDSGIEAFIGPPLREAIPRHLRSIGEPDGMSESILDSFRAEYRTLCVEMAVAYDGVPEALIELAAIQRLAIVTSKPTLFANPILESLGLDSLFELVEGIDPGLAEPKEVTLARAISRLGPGLAGRAMAMIGDRHHDVEAGRHLSLTTVGVTWGFGTEGELVNAGADVIVHEPGELADLFGA